ncbi:MAG: Fe-S cluster assembly protein IscX [Gammaproteobacteria bacterium]|jgi:FeS assembly protein IscX|uniref:Fe-S assembly protein IscX n=1 Tax=SAR86 cluster bacterium TaxID=2030880 RepID=A0A520N1D4_9GAMM|nr:Fe-S assembly protein IscX [Gammaproteobacteria bacterium]MBA4729528.1 Fe-S cluster assembly protein IscX [SAR86 cluster bacterium]RPG34860.1 MAG: Fe-S assembly protein IscX [Gammaproteobacteria bacterium TMED193]RZO27287.1 MAG: Fe-S assembly protein IscX [SAR86 cluster bacterium]|tara:strand:+ start:4763 stop:4960 length:198 start_codon:yes stop_codon:yes gene_type:complete
MLKWIDTLEIAIELCEKHPDIDPQWINFIDLRKLVIDLEDFSDEQDKSNEKILESIQLNWIKEKE